MRLRNGQGARRGIAATEMAILAPFLVFLMVGLWELGRYVTVQNLLDNAAREGGRVSASCGFFSSSNNASPSGGTITLVPPSTNGTCEVQKTVIAYLQAAGVNTNNVTVKVTNTGTATSPKNWSYTYSQSGSITGSGFDPTAAASQLDQLTVTVTVPYKNVAWSPLNLFISNSATLTATVSWLALTDVPLNITTTIPTRPLQPTDPLP